MDRIFAAVLAMCLAACTSSQANEKISDKDAARYNVQLGISYLQRNDLESAREKLERAVQQDPSLPSAHAALGILYERAGDMEKAGEHLRRAARLAPDDANMANSYGGFLCRRGQRDEGMRYFEAAAKNAYYRTPETALTNAGVCARGKPDFDAAEHYFRAALERNPSYPEALLQIADLNVERGEAMPARAFLQRYEAVGPATPASLWLGRRIEQLDGDARSAAQYAQRLRKEFPDSPQARRLARDGE